MRKQFPNVVKVLLDNDGVEGDDYWHFAVTDCGDPAVFCTGEFFGTGTGDIEEEGVHYLTNQGKITCPNCVSRIRMIKAVRLR